jgi:hypothetical protein
MKDPKWSLAGNVPWKFLSTEQRQEIMAEWPFIDHENHNWSRAADSDFVITGEEVINFTIIDPNNVERENHLKIEVNDDKTFVVNGMPIDAQQLAELGTLFFALAARAGIDDLDSCYELLDGFNLAVPVEQLKELANKNEA